MRYACFLRRLTNPARDLVDDHVVVGRVAPQQAAEANDCVILLGFSERPRGGRNFERAGHADDVDVLFPRP